VTLGARRPVYRISLENEQQTTLERVADRAIVSYASPVFHRSQDLFDHGTRGTIVENTTFPDVIEMSGHVRWYYNEPGATGIRNPDSEPVSFSPLSERLGALISSAEDVGSQSRELASLADAIRSSVVQDDLVIGAREAYLAEEWRGVDAFCDANGAPEAVRGFLAVDAFCRAFRLRWFAVSEQRAESDSATATLF
jgi:hypothetical protein